MRYLRNVCLLSVFTLSSFYQICKAQPATFDMEYITVSTDAQTAIQYAADIWSNYLISPVPIKVKVHFTILLPGQLGITFPNGRLNFAGAPVADVWYATCLANAITGTELNPGEPDMEIYLNSTANWYFGTDGNPGPGQYDLVSTALHEMCHGLGFLSLAKKSGSAGSFGLILASDFSPLTTSFPWPDLDTLPSIFDSFLENLSGTQLLSFENPSDTLGTIMTGANVYFNGPNVLEDNGGVRGRIYAPPTYTLGSSMTHWDEGVYPVGNQNELMTPNAAAAHANHDPGPLTLAVLDDIGWEINYDTVDVAVHEIHNEQIDLFPDPATDNIHFQLPDDFSAASIMIISAEGKLVYSSTLYTSENSIPVNTFPSGIYFIQWQNNDRMINATFCKR